MRALIVDDEPATCALLRGILARDFGVTVVDASSGVEALGWLARESFELVLLDLEMPGMDGMDVLRALRGDARRAQVTVGVMSPTRDEASVREAIDLGVAAYLTKPLTHRDLGERLQRLVARAGQRSSIVRDWSGVVAGGRVLVLDGNPDFLALVRTTLEPRYRVEVSTNGPAGILTCLERRPDLVLLGENLGVLPGQVFVDTLRSLPQLAQVPVVGMVTMGRSEMTGRVDATITRTIVPDQLRRQIDRAVAGDARLGG